MSLSCFVSPDAIIHEIGSSATSGNDSNSPETGGAYVIPSAMTTKDGYILAWELFASKLGPIRLQVSFKLRCCLRPLGGSVPALVILLFYYSLLVLSAIYYENLWVPITLCHTTVLS